MTLPGGRWRWRPSPPSWRPRARAEATTTPIRPKRRDPSTTGTTATSVASGPADASGVCWSAAPAGGSGVAFADETAAAGLVDPLTGMYGHAVAGADVDGDGWTDLFVGGFADRPAEDYRERGATGPSPDRLLRGGPDGFAVDEAFPGEQARTSGATFADLDA